MCKKAVKRLKQDIDNKLASYDDNYVTRVERKKDWKARMNQLSKVANLKSTNHVTKTL